MQAHLYLSIRWLAGLLPVLALGALACARPEAPAAAPAAAAGGVETGRAGGRLVAALRAEPRTFNPVVAFDHLSRSLLGPTMADLLTINRATQEVEPALAESWSESPDGLSYRLNLRRGVRFSDGEPFDADDVVFSFQVYLDESVGSPSRDLLIVGGQPIEVAKVDTHTVDFLFAEPYAAGGRLFDSFWILPSHLLEEAWRQGRLAEAWSLDTDPASLAGLGPFRLTSYRPGQDVTLTRNPYYWQTDDAGQRLPYLDEIVLQFVASEDAQVVRFQAGETDLIERLSPSNFRQLERASDGSRYRLQDLGPGLSFAFLVFNLNPPTTPDGDLARRQSWFSQIAFRRAVSAAIDRRAVVRLAYSNRATPLWSSVSPGNQLWYHDGLERPPHSPGTAREQLRSAGFDWDGDGRLIAPDGAPVEFSIMTSASNSQRVQATTLVQEDLRRIGMNVSIASLEGRAVIDRLLNRRDYDACVLELSGGDADPNPQLNVLLSSGALHLWRLGQEQPATPWEAEIDRLMRQQLSTRDRQRRKQMFDRVQELMAEHQPLVFLLSPHILVGSKPGLGNFQPAVLEPHTLWNTERLFWREVAE